MVTFYDNVTLILITVLEIARTCACCCCGLCRSKKFSAVQRNFTTVLIKNILHSKWLPSPRRVRPSPLHAGWRPPAAPAAPTVLARICRNDTINHFATRRADSACLPILAECADSVRNCTGDESLRSGMRVTCTAFAHPKSAKSKAHPCQK